MDERSKWPEAFRFRDDFDPHLACAELITDILSRHGRIMWFTQQDITISTIKTIHVDANDENDGRFRDAMRLGECIYSHVNAMVSAGDSHMYTSDTVQTANADFRAFTLEYGRLDMETVDEGEVHPEDYEWRSLAMVLIALDENEPIERSGVTLIDTASGAELDDEEALRLYGLISVVGDELRAMTFNDRSVFDDIPESGVEEDATSHSRVFEPKDFIAGTDCDECSSDDQLCQHNGRLN